MKYRDVKRFVFELLIFIGAIDECIAEELPNGKIRIFY